MLRLFVIKKKNIFYILVIAILSLISLLLLYLFLFNDTSLFSYSSDIHSFDDNSYDFTGDGLKDKLITNSNNNTYTFKIKTTSEEYTLIDNDNLSLSLDVCPWYKIQDHCIDLCRNNIPEIILLGKKNNIPSVYIYRWNGKSFTNIYNSQSNIVGIINSQNSNSPILYDTNLSEASTSTNAHILISNYFKDISFSQNQIPSMDSIEKFIDLIEYPYEITDIPDIFSSSIQSSELSLLWALNKDTYHYTCNSGYFYDINWNNQGEPSTILWTLSFKKENIISENETPSEFILYVQVDLDELSQYKISSIQK